MVYLATIYLQFLLLLNFLSFIKHMLLRVCSIEKVKIDMYVMNQ